MEWEDAPMPEDFGALARPIIQSRLAPRERLNGVVAAVQKKRFSSQLYAIGVTDQRLLVQPVGRQGEATDDPLLVIRDAVAYIEKAQSRMRAEERRQASVDYVWAATIVGSVWTIGSMLASERASSSVRNLGFGPAHDGPAGDVPARRWNLCRAHRCRVGERHVSIEAVDPHRIIRRDGIDPGALRQLATPVLMIPVAACYPGSGLHRQRESFDARDEFGRRPRVPQLD